MKDIKDNCLYMKLWDRVEIIVILVHVHVEAIIVFLDKS